MTNRVEHLAEGVTLYLGDCREVLPTLGRFDACVTDPPYGIGIANNPVRQKHARSDWDDAPPDASVFEIIAACSDEQIIWGGNYFGMPASQGFLVWDKKQPENFSLAMCEMAWCSRQHPAKMWRQSVTAYEKHHPTQKPVPLMEWCLRFLPKASSIVDPFCGAGTTGIAAVRAGKSFVGIEKDPVHFATSCWRIADELSRPRMFSEPMQTLRAQEVLF